MISKRALAKPAKARPIWKWLLITILILISVRLLISRGGLYWINKSLASELGKYTGKISNFKVSLFKGSSQILDLEIREKNSADKPLLVIKEMDLSLSWRGLLRKEITGDVFIQGLSLYLEDSKEMQKKPPDMDEKLAHWKKTLDLLVPISIESFNLVDSEIHFTNLDLKVPLVVKLDQMELSISDLRTRNSQTPSELKFTARLQNHAELKLDGKMMIFSNKPKVDFDFQLRHFKVSTVNKLLTEYVPIDVTGGTLDVFSEMALQNKHAIGYAKIFLSDGNIIAVKQEYKNLKHLFFELSSAFGNRILKNSNSNSLATRIPFEFKAGRLNLKMDQALNSILENRDEKLLKGFENSISFKSL